VNILIVEDEWLNANFIADVIERMGHSVAGSVTNAKEALQIAEERQVDLAIMDIKIEGFMNGIECATLLNAARSIPIVYMSAFKDTKTIHQASGTNIYGYLIKPYDEEDIEAVLNVAAARIKGDCKEEKILKLAVDYSYYPESGTLCIGKEPVKLTKKEAELLEVLSKNRMQTVSYEILQNSVWNEKIVSESNIRDTVSRLRKKAPLLQIENIIGVGYCLKV